MALKEALKEYLFLKDLYKELGIKVDPKIYTNSNSAIALAYNPEHYSKTKHIDIWYYFIRECVQDKLVDLAYINTKEQIADILTKAIDSPNFKRLRDYII